MEPNETFTVTLSSTDPNASMPAGPATGTITNDDAYVLSVNDVSIAEGNSGTKTATFTISISQSGSVPISVDYATSSGTATQGTDFVAASGQATITAGSTSTTFNVTTNGDTSVEADETFNVTLSNIVGPGTFTGGDSAGVGNI